MGQSRQFLFVQGQAVASDQPETLRVQRRGDVSVLRRGDTFERDEIDDALVLGGLRPPPRQRMAPWIAPSRGDSGWAVTPEGPSPGHPKLLSFPPPGTP